MSPCLRGARPGKRAGVDLLPFCIALPYAKEGSTSAWRLLTRLGRVEVASGEGEGSIVRVSLLERECCVVSE